MEKGHIKKLKNELKHIRDNKIQVTNQNGFLPQSQIPGGRKVYNIEASIMFVDLRNSTDMTNDIGRKNMVKIYKMYTKLAKQAVGEHYGKVLQIVGDGLLCAFVNDNHGNSGNNAYDAAITINTYIKEAMNPMVEDTWGIQCGIGIRTGHVYVTRLKANKKNSQVAYPSSITNYASKFCDEAKDGEVIFDAKTYKHLSRDNKLDVEEYGENYIIRGKTWEIE